MIDLILSVCMVSQPGNCKEEHLFFESRGTLTQCMMLSSPYVAQWAGDHPQWKVTSWKCEWPKAVKHAI